MPCWDGRRLRHHAMRTAAWSRFLEDRAATAPLVLVLEDLHWADKALLGFLEHLATHLSDVPMFILATTRPELFEAHEELAVAGVDRIEVPSNRYPRPRCGDS